MFVEELGDLEVKCDFEKYSKIFGKDVDCFLLEYEKYINVVLL